MQRRKKKKSSKWNKSINVDVFPVHTFTLAALRQHFFLLFFLLLISFSAKLVHVALCHASNLLFYFVLWPLSGWFWGANESLLLFNSICLSNVSGAVLLTHQTKNEEKKIFAVHCVKTFASSPVFFLFIRNDKQWQQNPYMQNVSASNKEDSTIKGIFY